jgi:hypothetical protein
VFPAALKTDDKPEKEFETVFAGFEASKIPSACGIDPRYFKIAAVN